MESFFSFCTQMTQGRIISLRALWGRFTYWQKWGDYPGRPTWKIMDQPLHPLGRFKNLRHLEVHSSPKKITFSSSIFPYHHEKWPCPGSPGKIDEEKVSFFVLFDPFPPPPYEIVNIFSMFKNIALDNTMRLSTFLRSPPSLLWDVIS